MQYFVVDPSGTSFGPADVPTLQQWVAEGRVQPHSTLRDAATGMTTTASAVPGLFAGGVPPPANPYGAPPPSYANYPRVGYGDDGSKDVQTAWIYAVLSLICCAVIFGYLGITTANRAIAKGNEGGRGPLILSWVGIGLWIVGFFFRIALLR